MIKYKTSGISFGKLIEEVDIEKETDKSVWINGRRLSRRSSWDSYHDTWDDAKKFLLDIAEQKLTLARHVLNKAQSEYGNVKGLKDQRNM